MTEMAEGPALRTFTHRYDGFRWDFSDELAAMRELADQIERARADAQPLSEHPSMTDIARRQYATGEFGSARFLVAQSTWETFERQASPTVPDVLQPNLGDLLSIPIRIDDTLPAGAWRLEDSLTGEVLYEGTEV